MDLRKLLGGSFRLGFLLPSSAVGLLALAGCDGDTPEVVPEAAAAAPTGSGAAVRYPQVLPPIRALGRIDIDLEVSRSGFSLAPPDPGSPDRRSLAETMAAFAAGRPAIDQVVEVALMEACEWPDPTLGMDGPEGIHAGMRQATRILTIDGLRLLVEGDQRGAARRLGASLGLARHLTTGSYVDSLVAAAILGLAAERIELAVEGFDGRGLDAEGRAALAAELARFDPKEPFGPAMSMESCVAEDARIAADPDVPAALKGKGNAVKSREQAMSRFGELQALLGGPAAK